MEDMRDTFKSRLGEFVGERKSDPTEDRVSVTSFAKTLGVTRQAMSRYLNGRTFPNAEMLYTICRKLNVSADYLLGLSNIKAYGGGNFVKGYDAGTSDAFRIISRRLSEFAVDLGRMPAVSSWEGEKNE